VRLEDALSFASRDWRDIKTADWANNGSAFLRRRRRQGAPARATVVARGTILRRAREWGARIFTRRKLSRRPLAAAENEPVSNYTYAGHPRGAVCLRSSSARSERIVPFRRRAHPTPWLSTRMTRDQALLLGGTAGPRVPALDGLCGPMTIAVVLTHDFAEVPRLDQGPQFRLVRCRQVHRAQRLSGAKSAPRDPGGVSIGRGDK
jgi:hypothetical protein